MRCPFCKHDGDKVIDSRPTDEGASIRRRRECSSCLKRFTTYEKIDIMPITVIKKDSTCQIFDRNKILTGLIKASEKRPVSMKSLENLTLEIENQLHNSLKKEISSDKIGEMVMCKLKDMDEVAYVRFASVYRQFKDISTFMDELKKLMNNN